MSDLRYIDDVSTALRSATVEKKGLGDDRWAAPVAVVDAPSGFGEELWALKSSDVLIAWLIAGDDVVSELPSFRGRRIRHNEPKCNLQIPSQDNLYLARSAVRFGHFYLAEPLLRRVGEGFDRPDFGIAQLRGDLIMFDDAELRRRLNHYAHRSLDRVHPPSRVEMEALALLVVERLVGVHHAGGRVAPRAGALAPWQAKRICDYLEDHLAADTSLSDLAALLDLSTFHFCRAFRESMGLPPHRWRHQRRMERARELLESTDLPVTEIAAQVGYDNPSQLSAAFRKALGVGPSQYRRQCS